MVIESYIQLAPDSTGRKQKTFQAVDGGGNTVEIMAVVGVDSQGSIVAALTEDTGQKLLAELKLLRQAFCDANNLLFQE